MSEYIANNNDELLFPETSNDVSLEEVENNISNNDSDSQSHNTKNYRENAPWKIVIADDEDEVHTMTRMVLKKFVFDNRKIELISAYSGKETKDIMREEQNVAIVLLDVVMENEESGLEVVKYIREELKNPFVRIILRTGQPGQAPEDDVIRNYDINDYKSKTELTVQKLYTSIIASLRSYIDMKTIEKSRLGLENILSISREMFKIKNLNAFVDFVLSGYIDVLNFNFKERGQKVSGFGAMRNEQKYQIISMAGDYFSNPGKILDFLTSDEFRHELSVAKANNGIYLTNSSFLGVFPSSDGIENFIYLNQLESLKDIDHDMIKILSSNVAVGYDNIYLNNEIIDTQKEVLYTLGEIVEFRSKETANHVRRVAEFSYILAKAYGLTEEEADLLRMASPMHDIGKIGIQDTILTKPAKLTDEEFDIVKTHSLIGYDILKRSNRPIMKAAATIALEHHERWNGNGYPYGKSGEEINIMSRITMIADVFDALSHKRVYKDAWDSSEVYEEIRSQKGIMFDPNLVDLFFEYLDVIEEIKNKYPG